MKYLRFPCLCLFVIGVNCASTLSQTTAKKCVYVYLGKQFTDEVADSVARHYDLVIMPDSKRWAVPIIRQKAIFWRKKPPLILVYKDCMTIIGPGNTWGSPGDLTIGGGGTVGGFWHFDSIFWGLGSYGSDTLFLMKSAKTLHYDSLGRVRAGSDPTYKWRWAMDRGKEYWARFYACSAKVQCLRNYEDTTYDNTYFDGVLMDNVLHFNKEYKMYSKQYWQSGDSVRNDSLFQNAICTFLQRVYAEFHNPHTPTDNPQTILAVGNNNKAFQGSGLWERYLEHLDGGMEESFAQTWQYWQDFDDWKRLVYEIEYAESQGKICLAHTSIDTFTYASSSPFSITYYDTTQMMYAFASYLMGYDSISYFSFQGDYNHFFSAPILDIDIGKPAGPYSLRNDSLAYRYFEKGVVFCNPSTSDKSVQISAKKYYMVRPSNDTITVEAFTVKPYHGAVFKLRE